MFKCKSVHNPPHSYGDCVRACVASLILDPLVPHVFDERPAEESWKALRYYLKHRGCNIALFEVDDPFLDMNVNNPDISYILLCGTDGGDHAVICRNGKVVHDPATNPTKITGPHSCGLWVVGIIVKL